MKAHLGNDVRRVQNKINHVGPRGGHKLHRRVSGIQQSRTPEAQEQYQVFAMFAFGLRSLLPFIRHDGVSRSGVRLGTGRDKTGLDEKLPCRPRLCRNLEVDHLSPFIDVRLCLASPGS